VAAWLTELQASTAAARLHEHTPLVEIQGGSDVPRTQPLFETLFVFENYPLGEAVSALPAGLRVTEVAAYERTHYPLTVVAAPGATLTVRFLADGVRVTAADAAAIAERFATAVRTLVAAGERSLGAVDLVSAAEQVALTSAVAAPAAMTDWLDYFEHI